MDYHSLRSSTAKALAGYLRAQFTQHGAATITAELLAAIETEALPPTVWYTWLNVSGDCQAISAGLHQSFSQYVRHASITKFSRVCRSDRIEEVWRAVGGTPGVVSFLSLASVLDVKHFCHEVGRTKGSRIQADTRQRCIDELYAILCQQDMRDFDAREQDQRPLQNLFHDMLPACSVNLTLRHLEGRKLDDSMDGLTKTAILTHCHFLRDRFLAMLKNIDLEVDVELMTALLSVKSSEVAHHHGDQLPTDVVFAVRTLQTLSIRDIPNNLKNDTDTFHRILATPLFKRLRWRKTSMAFVTEAIAAYVAYSARHIGTQNHISLQHNMVVEYLVRKWSRHSEQLEPCLIELFALVPKAQVVAVDQIEFLLALVTRPHRSQLLALATQHMPPLQLDIYSDAHLKSLPWTWTPEIFQLLPKNQARVLFERLIKVKPDPFGSPNMQIDQIHRDPAYFLLTLVFDDTEKSRMCSEAVEYRKTQASKARKQPERCFWVQYALRCATISGSVGLYRDTLRWTKRFTRDPLTAAAIYGEGHLHHTDTVNVLSGLATGSETISVQTVSHGVKTANLICQELLETACEGQVEPSFSRHFWQGVLDLLGAVVVRRLEQVDKCQEVMQLSNEEIYNVVWRDTLDVALRLEAIGLDEANAKLEHNTLGGPLMESCRWAGRPKIDDPRPATLRFLDNLARDRNEMWKAYRQSRRPDTWTLPDHFPRGLPFDCLLPVDFANCMDSAHMPFLLARARDVVFTHPDYALAAPPTDEELLSSIGPFWEDYTLALSHHVSWSENRLKAATHAWQHAIGPLSTPRLSEPEAFLFWSTIFSDRLDGLNVHGPWSDKFQYPAMLDLPSNDDMDEGQPLEWNPDPSPKAGNLKSRRLEPTNLDIMLDRPFDTRDTAGTSLMLDVEGRLPGRSRPAYWDRAIGRDPPLNARDTIIATALLYISAQNGQSPGLLAAPFPSAVNVRYPAMYLDGDFLDRYDLDSDTAFQMLRRYIDMLPPALLLDLLRGILSVADEKGTRTSQDALRILRLLIRCDKPQVALQVVSQVILERPEDSSWQRTILTPRLFKSLSKETARSFLFSLSTGIQDRIVEQTKRTGEPASNTPLIKVTTVKMLAQLLSGASFIDELSACEILTSILGVAKHIDIVCAVTESLTDTLVSTSNGTVEDTILTALQQYAVPIMSSVDERKPLGEDEWTQFESAPAEMPEVFIEGDASQLPPVWTAMLAALSRMQGQKRTQLFERVLLPSLQGSMQTNGRWLNLFCYHVGVPMIELSRIPLKLAIVHRLLASTVPLSAMITNLWLEVFKTIFDPPAEVLAITQQVEQDSKLRASNAGRHWLSLFSKTAISILFRGTQPAALLTADCTPRAGGSQIPQIQSIVLQQADLIIRKAGNSLQPWRTFIAKLAPTPWQAAAFLRWCQNTKPVLEQITKSIEALRTPTWQQDKHRTPPVIPSTFPLRLWLLCEPGVHALQRLQAGIQHRLEEIAAAKTPYAEHFNQIMTFIQTLGLSSDEKLRLAVSLGELDPVDNNIHLVHHLRVEMSRRLIQGVQQAPDNGTLRNCVVDLVQQWTESFDEDVRMIGLEMRDPALSSSQGNGTSDVWYVNRVEY